MAEQTIDRLQVEIESKATGTPKIEKLASAIERLRDAAKGGIDGLSRIAKSFAELNSSTTNVSEIGRAMNSLSKVKTDNLSSIATSIENLKSAASGSHVLTSLGTAIGSLGIGISEIKGKSGSIASLANSLSKLQGIDMSGVSSSMIILTESVKGLDGLGAGLESIRDFGKGVTSLSKSLSKIKELDLTGITEKIKRLVSAIKPLTDEMIRAGAGMSNFGDQMKALAQAAKMASSASRQVQKSLEKGSMTKKMNTLFNIGKIGAVVYGFKRVADSLAGMIDKSNQYIENMNLFTVAMGEAAEAGQNFAQKMQDLLGIDAGEAMRNMGLFQQLTTSFGVASNQATVLSKNLTQLGYDLSSFFNLPIEESFLKLQSGIAGKQTWRICRKGC